MHVHMYVYIDKYQHHLDFEILFFFLYASVGFGNSICLSTHSVDGDIAGGCLRGDIIEVMEYS